MTQTLILTQPEIDAQIGVLADRYCRAATPAVQALNFASGKAEGVLRGLPDPVRDRLLAATEQALHHAVRAASSSRSVVGDQGAWVDRALSSAMGAAGGMGGFATALAELPLTTTFLLRGIQGVAAQYGFDPAAKNVQFDCVQVFASAGPAEADDATDLAFLSARMVVTGSTLQTLIARVAPRLALVLGKKLAAQMVPVLGAAAGATTNFVFMRYYQEMAHVHFGLRKLALEADVPLETLIAQLREAMPLGLA